MIFDHLLIHNYTTGLASYGIKGSDNSNLTVRNCIIYDGQSSGIRLDQITASGIMQNCTVYGITGTGVYEENGTLTVTNTISMGNTTDFSGGTQSYNISADATAAGLGSLINKVAADQFVNFSTMDVHLKPGADAIHTGTSYKYKSGGRVATSADYDNTIKVADALYGHSRIKMPYGLVVLGY